MDSLILIICCWKLSVSSSKQGCDVPLYMADVQSKRSPWWSKLNPLVLKWYKQLGLISHSYAIFFKPISRYKSKNKNIRRNEQAIIIYESFDKKLFDPSISCVSRAKILFLLQRYSKRCKEFILSTLHFQILNCWSTIIWRERTLHFRK